jgi:hypothetical protein
LAACKLRAHLSDNSAKLLRDHLLALIDENVDSDAANALIVFAKNSKKEDLPELMTALNMIRNKLSMRVLAQVYMEFQGKQWTVANTNNAQDTVQNQNTATAGL